MRSAKPAASSNTPAVTVQVAVERAEKAVALKKWEESVQHYSEALELMYVKCACVSFIIRCADLGCSTKEHGEQPREEDAMLFFNYGRSLLENAIIQNSVLGRGQGDGPEDAVEPLEEKGAQVVQ